MGAGRKTGLAVAVLAALWGVAPAAGQDGAHPETVIDGDSRTQVVDTTVAPHATIGEIEYVLNGVPGRCTGFLIDRNTVVTAGHCLHSGGSSGDWATSVEFTAGRNGATEPHPTCSSPTWNVSDGWFANANAAQDWGVVQLDCTVGATTGWMRMTFLADSALQDRFITVTGYPGSPKPAGTMWTANDRIRSVTSTRVTHRADTSGGQDGSPIYRPTGCNGPCVYAIHTTDCVNCTPPNGNRGVRLTLPVIETITEIASENDPRPDGLLRLGNGPFVGDGIINGTGVNQVRSATIARGGTATFTARIQSDGTGPVDLRIQGHGGTSYFAVTYFAGPTNISSQVRAGTYAIDDLAVGTHRDIRIVIRAAGNTPANARVGVTLKATSPSAPNYRDVVRANAHR